MVLVCRLKSSCFYIAVLSFIGEYGKAGICLKKLLRQQPDYKEGRMKKRGISILLAFMLMLSPISPVFAASEENARSREATFESTDSEETLGHIASTEEAEIEESKEVPTEELAQQLEAESEETEGASDEQMYAVPVAMMHATIEGRKSMGDAALQGDALVCVQQGQTTYDISLKGINIQAIRGHLLKMYAYDADDTKLEHPVETKILETKMDIGLDGNESAFPSRIRIERPAAQEARIAIRVEVDAMGGANGAQDAFLDFDWEHATPVDSEDVESPEELENPDSPENHPDFTATDQATGIQATAPKGIVPSETVMDIKWLNKGVAFDTAKKELGNEGLAFILYQLQMLDREGNQVQPKGTVTIKYPIPEEYDPSTVALYHILQNGKMEKLQGKAENGFYLVDHAHFSDYALAGKLKDDTLPKEPDQPEEMPLSEISAMQDLMKLADGKYRIPLRMVKINRKDLSMSDGAIERRALLEKDGENLYLTIDFNGMTIGTTLGYLGKLSYYADGYTYDENLLPHGDLLEGEVLSYQEDGSSPDKVRIPIVNTALQDGSGFIALHVFVPVMEQIGLSAGNPGMGEQDVLAQLVLDKITKAEGDSSDSEDFEEPKKPSPQQNSNTDKSGKTSNIGGLKKPSGKSNLGGLNNSSNKVGLKGLKKAPKTGDDFSPVWLLAIIVICIAAFFVFRKKGGKTQDR